MLGLSRRSTSFPLLILSAETTGSGQEQHRGCQQFSHEARLPKLPNASQSKLSVLASNAPPLSPPRCVEAFRAGCYRHGDTAPRLQCAHNASEAGFLLYSTTSSGNNGRMSDHVYKKIELVGSSPNGFEDAIKNALARAEKTVRNMRWFEVTETRGYVENGKVGEWQVTLKNWFHIGRMM